jgi:hypothetical protein
LVPQVLTGQSSFLALPPAFADSDETVAPNPIPGGDGGTHHFLPGRGKEVSTITDFNGFVGVAQLTGTGKATGFAAPINFSVDNRFLMGQFVGVDGRVHQGLFGVF